MLTALARLAVSPMFASPEGVLAHHARLVGALRHAVRSGIEVPRAAVDLPPADKPMPWEERERVAIVKGTAVVPVVGMLASGLDPVEAWWCDCCRYEFLQSAAAELGARPDVHTVVFSINSPGGYASGSGETAALVGRALSGKLTVAWTAGQACSAAYALAASCARIVATPSATVGSIGSKMVLLDLSRLYAESGIDVKVYASGQYKGTGTPGAPITPEQDAFLQSWIDELGAAFKADVTARRPQVAEADMQGQWFTGAEAVARGLADATALSLGDLLAGIAGARARRI